MFSVLLNATSCQDQSKDQRQHREIGANADNRCPNADTEVTTTTIYWYSHIQMVLPKLITISKFLAQDNDFPAFWLVP